MAQEQLKTKYPVVRHGKCQHGVHAAPDTDPRDGSLWGQYTFCGLSVEDDQQNTVWVELPTTERVVTCKRCQRSLKSERWS